MQLSLCWSLGREIKLRKGVASWLRCHSASGQQHLAGEAGSAEMSISLALGRVTSRRDRPQKCGTGCLYEQVFERRTLEADLS
jgi:hypothetical protein